MSAEVLYPGNQSVGEIAKFQCHVGTDPATMGSPAEVHVLSCIGLEHMSSKEFTRPAHFAEKSMRVFHSVGLISQRASVHTCLFFRENTE